MSKNPADNNIQCLERALAILECVVERGEIGVSELGQAVGLHVATVHNILRTLSNKHYLLNVGGRYQPGAALAVLLARGSPLTMLARLAQPTLVELTEATGEATSLTVLVGRQARLIAFNPGRHLVTIHYPQWVWPDPLQLATGQVVTAFADERARTEILRAHLDREAAPTEAEWEQVLAAIRAEGTALLQSTQRDGQYAFACAVRGPGGAVLAALGASAPMFRAEGENGGQLQAAVRRSAAELSEKLCGLTGG